jgi:hypothetical protein
LLVAALRAATEVRAERLERVVGVVKTLLKSSDRLLDFASRRLLRGGGAGTDGLRRAARAGGGLFRC